LPSRHPEALFADILEGIARIDVFLSGKDFDAYAHDEKTKFAVERAMQIITEAAKLLGPIAEDRCPGHDWKGLRGMGDILRHAYHRVDDQTIWNTVKDELPGLRLSILAMDKSGPAH
jgi:uncharacterized protein with HEPN domain